VLQGQLLELELAQGQGQGHGAHGDLFPIGGEVVMYAILNLCCCKFTTYNIFYLIFFL